MSRSGGEKEEETGTEKVKKNTWPSFTDAIQKVPGFSAPCCRLKSLAPDHDGVLEAWLSHSSMEKQGLTSSDVSLAQRGHISFLPVAGLGSF